MLLAGRQTHNNIELFYGFKGIFRGLIMGSQNIIGSDYGSNNSAFAKQLDKIEYWGSKRVERFYCQHVPPL